MLSSTSHVRVQVEQTRMDVLRWLRRRWINVKQEGGFDTLESWALKEISHGKKEIVMTIHVVADYYIVQKSKCLWKIFSVQRLRPLPRPLRLANERVVLRPPTTTWLVCIRSARPRYVTCPETETTPDLLLRLYVLLLAARTPPCLVLALPQRLVGRSTHVQIQS